MLRDKTQHYYEREFQLGPEDVEELVAAAEATLDDSLTDLTAAFTEGADTAQVKDAAHALKGNLMNMGLPDQAGQALLIEQTIDSEPEKARAVYEALLSELMTF